MAATPGTPWWERKEAELKERSADDATCSISSSETYSCRTAPDENGVLRRKCERTVRKFRMCPGRAPEEIESSSEKTEEENIGRGSGSGNGGDGGGGGGGSSTTFETSFFKTFGTELAPGAAGAMPSLPFPFAGILGGAFPFGDSVEGKYPYGDDRRGGAHEVEGGVFGPMAGIFKGLFEFARELERMDRTEVEPRRAEGDVGGGGGGAPVPPRIDR